MKKLIATATLIVTVLTFASPSVFAATSSSGPYTVSASVDGTLSMSVVVRKNSSVGAIITAVDFGKLVDIGANTLRSAATSTTGTRNATAMITANSHGLPYTITQTGTTLSNGTTTLPSGACTVVPVYATQDNGGLAKPAGAVVGTAGSWVGTRTLYTSETGIAAMRTIQAVYSITDDPIAGATSAVPLNQAGGNYSGTVTITVTA